MYSKLKTFLTYCRLQIKSDEVCQGTVTGHPKRHFGPSPTEKMIHEWRKLEEK
jgi:hypothetical protein